MFQEASYLPKVWAGSQVNESLLPAVARPLAAHVKLTENCQAKCISCDYWKSRWQDRISTERAVELINEIGAAGVGSLRFTGGEPLLRTDFFKIMDAANTAPFKSIILQTNGLLLKKLHADVNASPITKVCVSIDGLKPANDLIRGIKGYFDLGMEGIQLLRGKEVTIAVTLNRISAGELEELSTVANSVGAKLQYNILTRNLFFFKGGEIDEMWPQRTEVTLISKFLRDVLKRPDFEIDYITKHYNGETQEEPPCVLGYTQAFILSNGDVLTGCYPLPAVGNILKDSFQTVIASEAYSRQCVAMVKRECPGCTCGIETSLAMKNPVSSAFFELGRLWNRSHEDKTHSIPPQPEMSRT
jgi:MoaA/NifB/PqqE/SkfB family radical SAM enzyme